MSAHAPDSPGEAPFITVVMPVRNEARFVRSTIGQLLDQDYPPGRFEIVVADGRSDDETPRIVRELAREHPNVVLADNPARLSGAGRNVGFTRGRGELFLVVDGHCHIPSRRLLADLARLFAATGAHCLGRPQHLDPPDATAFQRAVALARSSPLGHGGGSLIYGGHEGYMSPVSNGAAYRREVLDAVGLVDEAFDACEDVEFNWRVEKAGLRSYTSPCLMVKYYPREDLGGLWRQMLRYGRGRWRLWRKHPATLGAATLAPPLFVACMAACLPGCLLAALAGNPGAALAFALPPLAYLAAVLAESLRLCLKHRQGDPREVPLLAAIFAAIHAGLGAGFLLGAAGAARDAWRNWP